MNLQNPPCRVFAVNALFTGVVLLSMACRKHSAASATASRTYRMGFALSAPRPDINEIIQSLDIWTTHADAAIISTEVPWDSLIGGETPANYVINNYSAVVNIYRTANLKIWVYIDPENGLNRQSDSDPLVALGKSIAQSDIQMLYRRFVVAMDSIIHPDHLGLALETNLIRYAAPDSIYQGVKQAANAAAADVRAIDAQVPLSVSVQAEVAWGELGTSSTGYVGVSTDFTDFPVPAGIGYFFLSVYEFPISGRYPPQLLLSIGFRTCPARLCFRRRLDLHEPARLFHPKQPRPTAGIHQTAGPAAVAGKRDGTFSADLHRPVPFIVARQRCY
jgi:hypothetical protein